MSKSPYDILHLEEDASYDEIKERYRHLTRNLHPDKQPLENYRITKKLFEQVDEAYKSIASPLRRFLFREYGMPALRVLEDVPSEFEEFNLEALSSDQQGRLRQLMVYMLYEREAGFEMDKTKFNTKSLLNISKLMRRRPPQPANAPPSKRNLSFPEIENTSFDYEMVLPDTLGFSNSLAVSHSANNLRADPKYLVGTTLTSVKRLHPNYMMIAQASVSSEETNFEVNFDRVCENNLHLKLTPLSVVNGVLARPKLAVEKAFNHLQFSAMTDLASTSFQFSESSQRKVSRSLKLYIEAESIGVMPRVEWQMAANLRFFIQVSSGFNFSVQESSISMHHSLNYGYKLALHDDLKLELTSSIGYPNYFQLSLVSSKYRASLPFAAADSDSVRFQLLKVAAMLLTYGLFEGHRLRQRRNKKLRLRLLKVQENRLNESRRELQKQLSYVEMSAITCREKEARYNGLVVLKAYLGEKTKVRALRRRVDRAGLPGTVDQPAEEIPRIEERISQLIVLEGEPGEEVSEVTLLVQNEVNGAQLIGLSLDELNKFSPCIFDSVRPHLLLVYFERGVLRTLMVESRGRLSLGGFRERTKGVGYSVRRGWARMINYFLARR